jgi:integrase
MQQPETIEIEPATQRNQAVLKRRFGRDVGPDLRYSQALLGHKSSKTTVIYTHLSQTAAQRIIYPLERLGVVIEGNKE